MQEFGIKFQFTGYVIFEKPFSKNGFEADIFKLNSMKQIMTVFVADKVMSENLKKQDGKVCRVTGLVESQTSGVLRLSPEKVEPVKA